MTSPLTSSDVGSLFSSFGSSGTYTPNGGSGSSASAIVDRGAREVQDEAGNFLEALDLLTFKRSEVDPPARNARWTNGTDTWLIGDVVFRDEDTVRVEAREV